MIKHKRVMHVKLRIWQRLALLVSREDIIELSQKVLKGDYELAHWVKGFEGIYLIHYWDKEFYAVFNYELEEIVTVLNLDMELYDFIAFR